VVSPRRSCYCKIPRSIHIYLPHGGTHRTKHTSRMATLSTSQRPTALVIDEESSVRSTIRRAFEPEICNVVEAEDGVRGIQIVSRGAPPTDLVLVDLMLPNLDSLEVIESLSRSHPGLPRLCITGFGATATALLESTLTDYHVPVLLKPFKAEEIVEAVRLLLERAARRSAHAAE
jgi:two-component system, NtrC family, nitrogen regulation response regulator NtrX